MNIPDDPEQIIATTSPSVTLNVTPTTAPECSVQSSQLKSEIVAVELEPKNRTKSMRFISSVTRLGINVTRFGNILSFLETNFLTNVAQLFW